jgi:glyoxylase-like metal-dependent hydrolase (beta-lactamase superfamily II)
MSGGEAVGVPKEPGEDQRPPLVADASQLIQITDGVWVLPDLGRTPHVPNIGFIVGERAALVVDSGMGIANGEQVLEIARGLAAGLPLYLTSTHFHPEHGLGAQPFVGQATIVMNERQREELFEKCQMYIDIFSGDSEVVAEALAGVELVPPDVAFAGEAWIDLGGRRVHLAEWGDGHTRGDQVVRLPEERIVFAGDLIEDRFFAVLPDADSDGNVWIKRLQEIEALDPTVIVPGHGDVGGLELSLAARTSLEEIRDRTTALAAAGFATEELAATVEAEQIARHPDWDNGDWVGPAALNFFSNKGGTR